MMPNCWVECSTNPKNMMKIFKAIFLENRNFNCLNKTTHNCEGWSKTKKPPRNICKRTLDKGFERDWSVCLGAVGRQSHRELKKIYIFSSVRNFSWKNRQCYVVGFECTINPQNFIKIVGAVFWENLNV